MERLRAAIAVLLFPHVCCNKLTSPPPRVIRHFNEADGWY